MSEVGDLEPNGRDSNGRFAPGNSGSSGRPAGPRNQQAYLNAMRDGVSLEDWAAIVAKAVDDAKAGNRHARSFLARHLLPPPVAKLALTVPTGEQSASAPWDEPAMQAFVTGLSDAELSMLRNVPARMRTLGIVASQT